MLGDGVGVECKGGGSGVRSEESGGGMLGSDVKCMGLGEMIAGVTGCGGIEREDFLKPRLLSGECGGRRNAIPFSRSLVLFARSFRRAYVP